MAPLVCGPAVEQVFGSYHLQMGERFVVRLPLKVNARELKLCEQRLLVVGKLRNAVLGDLLARGERMRQDPRWLEARERKELYKELRREHGLNDYGAREIARRHWQSSGWMSDLLDGRTVHALASEILQNVDEWLYGRAERPRFKPAKDSDVVWGESDQAGLVYRNGQIRWLTKDGYRRPGTKLGRKSLRLEVDWSAVSKPRREYYAGLRVVRAGIQRESVRGRTRLFALLCYEGQPYRNLDYLSSVPSGVVGVDLGPSRLAAVGETDSALIDLSPNLEAERKREAYLRRQRRALERSRRATNPDCFDEQGRFIKGKRIETRSKRYEARRARIKEQERKRAIKRERQAIDAAQAVVRLGSRVATEKVSIAGWASSGLRLGKRIGLVAPSRVLARLKAEAERLGGEYVELPTRKLALSQRCLCGARVKKPLSQRFHLCESCGLGPLDRDLFSALLARLVLETGVLDLGDAPFGAGVQTQAERLCAPRQARGVTGNPSGGSKTRSRVNSQPDPADKSLEIDDLGEASLKAAESARELAPAVPMRSSLPDMLLLLRVSSRDDEPAATRAGEGGSQPLRSIGDAAALNGGEDAIGAGGGWSRPYCRAMTRVPALRRLAPLARLCSEEDGQGLVEWALIIGLVTLVAIAAVGTFGQSVLSLLTQISNAL